jgi:hypothetical protein
MNDINVWVGESPMQSPHFSSQFCSLPAFTILCNVNSTRHLSLLLFVCTVLILGSCETDRVELFRSICAGNMTSCAVVHRYNNIERTLQPAMLLIANYSQGTGDGWQGVSEIVISIYLILFQFHIACIDVILVF